MQGEVTRDPRGETVGRLGCVGWLLFLDAISLSKFCCSCLCQTVTAAPTTSSCTAVECCRCFSWDFDLRDRREREDLLLEELLKQLEVLLEAPLLSLASEPLVDTERASLACVPMPAGLVEKSCEK